MLTTIHTFGAAVNIYWTYIPGERATDDCPGSRPEAEVDEVLVNGSPVDLNAIDNDEWDRINAAIDEDMPTPTMRRGRIIIEHWES